MSRELSASQHIVLSTARALPLTRALAKFKSPLRRAFFLQSRRGCATEPKPEQRRERDQRKKPVDTQERGARQHRNIGLGWRGARPKIAPHRGGKTKSAEENENTARNLV